MESQTPPGGSNAERETDSPRPPSGKEQITEKSGGRSRPLWLAVPYEIYHLILVAGIPVGAIYLQGWIRELTYPRSDGSIFFFMMFPALLYGALRLAAGEVRPGRVALNLIAAILLISGLRDAVPFDPDRVLIPLMGYCLFCFGLGWMVLAATGIKKRRRAAVRMKAVSAGAMHAGQTLHAAPAQTGRFERSRPSRPRSRTFRVVFHIYHLVVVGAANYGFLVAAAYMLRADDMRTTLAVGLLVLAYPAALCGLLAAAARGFNVFRAFIGCALSSVILAVSSTPPCR